MSEQTAKTLRTSDDEWRRVMGTNLDGVVHRDRRRSCPGMVERRWGRVVTLSACLGRMSGPGTAGGLAPYRVSKAAVNALTKNLAAELGGGRRGVLVDAVCPGHCRTDMGGARRAAQRRARARRPPCGWRCREERRDRAALGGPAPSSPGERRTPGCETGRCVAAPAPGSCSLPRLLLDRLQRRPRAAGPRGRRTRRRRRRPDVGRARCRRRPAGLARLRRRLRLLDPAASRWTRPRRRARPSTSPWCAGPPPATGSASLVVNPGGPGASAVELPAGRLDRHARRRSGRASTSWPSTRAASGRATPVRCATTGRARRLLRPRPDARRRRGARGLRAGQRGAAPRAARSAAAPLLPHVSTRDGRRRPRPAARGARRRAADLPRLLLRHLDRRAVPRPLPDPGARDGARRRARPDADLGPLLEGQSRGFDDALEAFLADCQRPRCAFRARRAGRPAAPPTTGSRRRSSARRCPAAATARSGRGSSASASAPGSTAARTAGRRWPTRWRAGASGARRGRCWRCPTATSSAAPAATPTSARPTSRSTASTGPGRARPARTPRSPSAVARDSPRFGPAIALSGLGLRLLAGAARRRRRAAVTRAGRAAGASSSAPPATPRRRTPGRVALAGQLQPGRPADPRRRRPHRLPRRARPAACSDPVDTYLLTGKAPAPDPLLTAPGWQGCAPCPAASVRRKIAVATWRAPRESRLYARMAVDATAVLEHCRAAARGARGAGQPGRRRRDGLPARHRAGAGLPPPRRLRPAGAVPQPRRRLRRRHRGRRRPRAVEGRRRRHARRSSRSAASSRRAPRGCGPARTGPTRRPAASPGSCRGSCCGPVLMLASLLNGGLGVRAFGQPAHPLGSLMVTNIGSFGLDEGYVAQVPLARTPLYVCVGAVQDAPMAVDGAGRRAAAARHDGDRRPPDRRRRARGEARPAGARLPGRPGVARREVRLRVVTTAR